MSQSTHTKEKLWIFLKRGFFSLPYFYGIFNLGLVNAAIGSTIILLEENVGVGRDYIGGIFIAKGVGFCVGSICSGFVADLLKKLKEKLFHTKGNSSMGSNSEDDENESDMGRENDEGGSEKVAEKTVEEENDVGTAKSDGEIKKIEKTEDGEVRDKVRKKETWFMSFLFSINMLLVIQALLQVAVLIAIPFTRSVVLLIIEFFFIGFCGSVIECLTQVGISDIWREDMNVPSQVLHSGFGIGLLLFPLIYAEILKNKKVDDLLMSWFTCVILVGFSIPLLIVYNPPESPNESEKTENTKTTKKEKSKTVKSNVYYIFVSVFLCVYCCFELTYSDLVYYYIVRSGIDTEVGASYVISLFSLSFTIGRLLGIFQNIFIPVSVLIVFNLVFSVYSSIVLTIFSEKVLLVKVFSCVIGFFMSLLFPSAFAMPKVIFGYEITGIGTSFTLVGVSFAVGMPSLVKVLMDKVDLRCFFYCETVFVFLCCISFIVNVLIGIVDTKKIKFKKTQQKEEIND